MFSNLSHLVFCCWDKSCIADVVLAVISTDKSIVGSVGDIVIVILIL